MNRKRTQKPEPLSADSILAKAGEAAAFLRLLAQEHRLAILCTLLEQPSSVGELAGKLGLAQPKVSQHLAILRARGLVGATRQGTRQHYRVDDDTARQIVANLQTAFCPPGGGRRREPERKV